jgi:two-component system response regulator NreC
VDTIDVAIADDHGILRSGVRMLINSQPDMRVVAEASGTAEIISAVERAEPHILLLDIGLAGDSGLTALKQMRTKRPLIRAIILTMHSDVALMRSAVAEGAAGFVLKQAADTELLLAIRAVHRGGLFIDPSLAAEFMAEKATAPAGNLLSRREKQVLQLIAQGNANQEIANRLYVSVKTVETYRARLAEKLGLRSRKEITRYALLTGLLSPEDFP